MRLETVAAFVLANTALLLAPTPVCAQAVLDQWSPASRWRAPDGWFGAAVHAILLPDGRVMCIGTERDSEDPAQATATRRASFTFSPVPLDEAVPVDTLVQELQEPLDIQQYFDGRLFAADDLFCTAQTLDSQGRVLTAGGTRFLLDVLTGESATIGLAYATRFDGLGWQRLFPDTQVQSPFLGAPARWYGTLLRLHDRRLLLLGGFDIVFPAPNPNRSAEVLDPATGVWSVLSDYGEPPVEITSGNYAHAVLLPRPRGENDVLVLGDAGQPVLLSLEGDTRWSVSPRKRPGTQPGQASGAGSTLAMLPLRVRDGEWGYANGSVLIAGGHEVPHRRRADVYDPMRDAWHGRTILGIPRTDPTAVLLPDGRVAVLGGHDEGGAVGQTLVSYIDPANGFAVATGVSDGGEVRGYHNVALLLPDGRVLAGGGRDQESGESGEKASFRYLLPSYLFGPRPVIEYAPEVLPLGERVLVVASGRRPAEVVLMSLGAMTHSFDTSQRAVQLEIELTRAGLPGLTALLVNAPRDGRVAPPGTYMLFVLDADRIPSVARIVRVE